MRCLLLVGLLWISGLAAAGEPARRVVSLAPSLSEIMLELGAAALLVGVLDGGERPAALAHLPSVGRYAQLELERLLALRPDLVLLWPDSISAGQQQQLRQLGLTLQVVEPRDLAQLAGVFTEIGERVGRGEAGRRLSRDFVQGMAALRRDYHREPPLRVFYQVWDVPLYTLGGAQIVSDALRVCGARNVFDELAQPAPQVSLEAVLHADPAVILVSAPGLLAGWQAWPTLQAVRRKQVWVVPDTGLERPSFQMLAATEKLCQLLAQAR
ncbi:MAG: helical backbone metal receptor [Pseudomonas sp.]|uniref:helical backbone metal receptor n=1 Tax=Pseudomonas sp. TaxID=306 RepID=UPI003399F607